MDRRSQGMPSHERQFMSLLALPSGRASFHAASGMVCPRVFDIEFSAAPAARSLALASGRLGRFAGRFATEQAAQHPGGLLVDLQALGQ